MANQDITIDSVNQRLLEYLAGEGFGITTERRAELLARLAGHANAHAHQLYLRRSAVFFVLKLHLDDLDVAGSPQLTRTLENLPLLETASKEEADAFAKQQAALLNSPVVVANGAYELLAVHDEPTAEVPGWDIWISRGKVYDPVPAQLDDSLDENLVLISSGYTQKRMGVAVAKRRIAANLNSPLTLPQLFVADKAGVVVWNS